jgi:TolB protein
VGHWLLAILLAPWRVIGRFAHKPLHYAWQFTGRLGLATRDILSWTVGETYLLLFKPLILGFWRLLGRMGAAIRRLLTIFAWRPFLFFSRPFTWAFWKFVWPVWTWLARRLQLLGRFFWRKTARRRTLYGRRLKSRWIVWWARWRLFVKRPSPPSSVIRAPRLPLPPNIKLMRITTALASVGIVLIVGFVTAQPAKTGSGRVVRVVITPTPLPPTAFPTPDIEIELTPWPTPDPLNEGGSVAFTLVQPGNSDIYVLSVGQSKPARLTSHPAPDRDPAWSPDGRDLAFASKRDGNWEVYVYNLPSGLLHRITTHSGYDGSPNWSPDGQWLVYDSYQANNFDIYIVKADLSEGPFRLTNHPAHDYAPVWAPGGRHLTFTSWRSGNKDIYLLSLDQISDETAVNITQSPDLAEDSPAFSPDGRFLAYHEDSSGFDLIYAAPLAEDATLAETPIHLGQQGRYPAWSPNSQSLFYVHNQGERSFLIAGSPDAWGIAPQTFAADGRIEAPHWSAVTLPPDIAQNLRNIDTTDFSDELLFREALAPAQADGPPVELFELPINAPSPYLNDRVDQSFLALRQRVLIEAGWDFLGQLDQLFVDISSKPLPGLPGEDWNQAGRAFDVTDDDALTFEPRLEVIREDIGSQTFWRIYLRAERQDGSQGEPLRQLPWDFRARFGEEAQYFDEGGRVKESIPAGYYVDFTALAADYGWQWVPATANWRTFYPGIRFWHYENRQGLTWQQAMLEIYTEAEFAAVFGESVEE